MNNHDKANTMCQMHLEEVYIDRFSNGPLEKFTPQSTPQASTATSTSSQVPATTASTPSFIENVAKGIALFESYSQQTTPNLASIGKIIRAEGDMTIPSSPETPPTYIFQNLAIVFKYNSSHELIWRAGGEWGSLIEDTSIVQDPHPGYEADSLDWGAPERMGMTLEEATEWFEEDEIIERGNVRALEVRQKRDYDGFLPADVHFQFFLREAVASVSVVASFNSR